MYTFKEVMLVVPFAYFVTITIIFLVDGIIAFCKNEKVYKKGK